MTSSKGQTSFDDIFTENAIKNFPNASGRSGAHLLLHAFALDPTAMQSDGAPLGVLALKHEIPFDVRFYIITLP